MKNPLALFDDSQIKSLTRLIKKKQNNYSELELEVQISFPDSSKPYSQCLIKSFIGSDYTAVPVIKKFGTSNLRSIYVGLGGTLMLENSMKKEKIDVIDVENDIYNYDFGVTLSSETIVNTEVKKPTKSAYQNRYSITNLSKFWRIDIIEYGDSKKNWNIAKENWKQRPRTRVEVEYAPASYYKDISEWTNPVALKEVLGEDIEDMDSDEFKMKVNQYIADLNKTDPLIVLKDLAEVLIKIFNTLDMYKGNRAF